jgi:FkbM family methyltransferase
MDLSLEEYEKLNPHIVASRDGTDAVFCTPNRQTAWRVDTLFTKEPDTIAWIAGFAPGEILFDVGANVGMYSIWAALTRNVRVFAFEPESQNFALLNRNIWTNALGDRVTALPLAVSDQLGFDRLYLSEFVAGSSYHNFGEALDYKRQAFASPFAQGCLTANLDYLIEQGWLPVPHHIKIDVDGIEPAVIAGARQTLANPQLKTLLIEIDGNLDTHWGIVDTLLDAGFDYSREEAAQAVRKEGVFKGLGNYVFRR